MVFTNTARNALRDKAQSDIDEAAIGTDGTTESTTDTSIGSEVLSKAEGSGLTESDNGDGGAMWEFTVGLAEANNNTLREVVLRNSTNSDTWIRITHQGIPKDNSFELDYEITTSKDNA